MSRNTTEIVLEAMTPPAVRVGNVPIFRAVDSNMHNESVFGVSELLLEDVQKPHYPFWEKPSIHTTRLTEALRLLCVVGGGIKAELYVHVEPHRIHCRLWTIGPSSLVQSL